MSNAATEQVSCLTHQCLHDGQSSYHVTTQSLIFLHVKVRRFMLSTFFNINPPPKVFLCPFVFFRGTGRSGTVTADREITELNIGRSKNSALTATRPDGEDLATVLSKCSTLAPPRITPSSKCLLTGQLRRAHSNFCTLRSRAMTRITKIRSILLALQVY
ncbi:hypothetical protein EDD18DRAFT_1184989 [Armillaria luteobubalina]|uniref:Uncharacterized protein n=1 Tax=Armillaria luteobubalina TaxID=153913 RepID=A0AA39PY56_9AGAR|nr:hypothetical protein EDD18DRAFT_1184989 [Armillaria luteobubalina]